MKIEALTKELATEFQREIVELHNMIPFQHWSGSELLSEGDDKRQYELKWDLSSICFAGGRDTIVGICLAFVDSSTDLCGIKNFLYIHRIVVHPDHRFMGIGKALIKNVCQNYKNLNQDGIVINRKVMVSTPVKSLGYVKFQPAENFYLHLGFKQICQKNYIDRVDDVLESNVERILLTN